MRSRIDFYTLCPECDARITLTLAAQLQATRRGTSCRCRCGHDWTCISEWIYRSTPDATDTALNLMPQAQPPAMSPPRPYLLPTYQPPMPTAAPQQTVGDRPLSIAQPHENHSQPSVPAPHAFSPANSDAPRRSIDPYTR